ncbi:GNAT family N-acetyltransferase [Haloarchaeobius iranensis]|uniref:GNAT family N-acetyltransferase n=1 Tax=Haloarchaeobius iranensis TaxID=996166 RepID=UPI000B7DE574|nr:GNAT family N-acetyltransferase [Haloarchaeobius iranensis]
MPSPLSIRRYRPADAERVRSLHVEALRDVGAFFADTDVDVDLLDVEASYLDSGGGVGTVADRTVAMGAFRPPGERIQHVLGDLPDDTAELKRMRVDPAHQRRGYGQQVLDELERRARESGYRTLVLDVTDRQPGAKRFYEDNDCSECGSVEVSAFAEPFVQRIYRKELE